MKKTFNLILTILLLSFSFYYTNIVSTYLKNKDPIMLEIKANQQKYLKKPINATIDAETIIPGLKGYEINVNESYSNMKKINSYSESLLVFQEITPTISLKDNLDKIIIQGNPAKKNISILLKTNNLKLLEILKEANLLDNFNFILSKQFIENNSNFLQNIKNNIISDDATNDLANYCYTLNTTNKVSCQDKKTVAPTFITHDYYYSTYQVLTNGKILAYNLINEKNLEEILSLVNNIKSLGYKIVNLDTLLEE